MNYNEELKRNILIKLAENININFENQQIVERVLVELLQDTQAHPFRFRTGFVLVG